MTRRNIFLRTTMLALSLLLAGAAYGRQGSVTPQGAVIIDGSGQDDGAQASSQGAVRLRVVTWNVKGGKCDAPRYEVLTVVADHLVRLKREEGLDVVALQEVFEYQADGLAAALNFRNVHFSHTIDCGGGKRRGNAILSRYSFEAGSRRHHKFDVQHPEEKEERNVVGAAVKVEGRTVYLFSTHLTSEAEDPKRRGPSKKSFCRLRKDPCRPETGSVPSNQDSCEANFWRAQQAAEAVSFAESYRPRDRAKRFRSILMGDFNAERNPHIDYVRNAYRLVTERYRDAWVISAHNRGWEVGDRRGYTNPTSSVYECDAAFKRIDYVFLREGSAVNVVSAARLRRTGEASDHYPVRAVLAFN